MAKRFTQVMFALPWKRHKGKAHPDVLTCGAWMLTYSKEMAENRMLDVKQKPRKVRVTIERG